MHSQLEKSNSQILNHKASIYLYLKIYQVDFLESNSENFNELFDEALEKLYQSNIIDKENYKNIQNLNTIDNLVSTY
jgi:uncharacterized protein YqgQ